jgi:hypothetical protein
MVMDRRCFFPFLIEALPRFIHSCVRYKKKTRQRPNISNLLIANDDEPCRSGGVEYYWDLNETELFKSEQVTPASPPTVSVSSVPRHACRAHGMGGSGSSAPRRAGVWTAGTGFA